MHVFRGRTADDAWRAAAAMFAPGGPAAFHVGRGEKETAELLHVMLEIEDPRERWVVSRTPPMNPAFALVEVFWILAGRRDAAFLAHWNRQLHKFVGDAPVLSGAYGFRLRHHLGLDQIDRVYHALGSAPGTRQAVLQIWDAATDLPKENGTPTSDDIPCNVVAMPKVRNGRLEWLQVMRSNDLFLGLPHNVVQFTALQEMMAGWLGLGVGSYHHVSDTLHVYVEKLEAVTASTTIVPIEANEDSFGLPRREWDEAFEIVMQRLNSLTADTASESTVRALAFAGDLPRAYENAVRIAAADSARRRGFAVLAEDCAAGCSNALRTLWDRWVARAGRTASEGSAVGAREDD